MTVNDEFKEHWRDRSLCKVLTESKRMVRNYNVIGFKNIFSSLDTIRVTLMT
jgi:hypothetical protein